MSSYMKFETALFLRAIMSGMMLCAAYRIFCGLLYHFFGRRGIRSVTDFLYWLAAGFLLFFALFRWNYGELRLFLLPGALIGAFFANYLLNLLLFPVKRCSILIHRHLKRRNRKFRRGRRFEKIKKENQKIANNYLGMAAIAIVVLILLVGLTMQSNNLKARIAVYDAKAAALSNPLRMSRNGRKRSKQQKEYMQTDEYMAEVAREAGTCQGNEIVFEEEK